MTSAKDECGNDDDKSGNNNIENVKLLHLEYQVHT